MENTKDSLTIEISKSRQRANILDLPQAAYNGRPLYYGKEACLKKGLVTVKDNRGVDWVSGVNGLRYRVKSTLSNILGPFPGLDSGRDQKKRKKGNV